MTYQNRKLVLDGIIYSIQKGGGISVYFRELVSRALSDARLEASFMTFNPYSDNFMPAVASIPSSMRSLERYRDLKIQNEFDIFHSSYYRLPAKNNGRLVVTTVHDFVYERFFTGLPKVVHSFQKRRAIMASDAIICISHQTRRDLLHFLPDVSPEKIRVIYNGFSPAFRKLHRPDATSKVEKPFVLYVGSRASYKNFTQTVRSLSSYESLNLKIVGGGPLTNIEISLLECHVRGRYEFFSYVSDEELNSLYNSAFCLVYPSMYEGFGIPVLEAMAAGCPVVALNTSSIPEVAGSGAILLNDSSPESIVQALDALQSQEFRNSLVQKGFAQAQNFSWDKTYEQTVQLYLSLQK